MMRLTVRSLTWRLSPFHHLRIEAQLVLQTFAARFPNAQLEADPLRYKPNPQARRLEAFDL